MKEDSTFKFFCRYKVLGKINFFVHFNFRR
jgi:hypothetical protein